MIKEEEKKRETSFFNRGGLRQTSPLEKKTTDEESRKVLPVGGVTVEKEVYY